MKTLQHTFFSRAKAWFSTLPIDDSEASVGGSWQDKVEATMPLFPMYLVENTASPYSCVAIGIASRLQGSHTPFHVTFKTLRRE
jgi:hypothetical protein